MKKSRQIKFILSIAAIMAFSSAVVVSQNYQFRLVPQNSVASEEDCIDEYSSEENCTDDYDFQCDY